MKENISNGVILGLAGKKGQDDAFARFLNNEKPATVAPDAHKLIKNQYKLLQAELDTAKEKYSELLELHKGAFEDLVLFETIITQIRCQLTIVPKFALVKRKKKNETKIYLTARAPFFSPKLKRNEVRVYMGELEKFGSSLDEVQKKKQVIETAKAELFKYMNMIIGDSLKRALSASKNKMDLSSFKFFQRRGI
jgi:hypothetical protein